MIDLKFGLFWHGEEISYLRYITFVTLRHFHPDCEIELYIPKNYSKENLEWREEKQDFQSNNIRTLIPINNMVDNLGVRVIEIDKFGEYPPNYQSDFFRWWWLNNNNGFYLDTDQIILKSFNSLGRDYNLIYSEYKSNSCGVYTPVGVIGSSGNSEIVSWANDLLSQYYDKNDYNSVGPWMFRSLLHSRKWGDKIFNSGKEAFYPISESYMVPHIYNGDLKENHLLFSYSLHWFGGHPESQKFNEFYNKDFAISSNDSISVFLRGNNLL